MAAEPKNVDWTIYQGRTFQYVVRWETTPVVYKQITGITRAAPVVLTVPSHGLADGWYAAVTDVGGMTEINAESNTPRVSDYRQATVVDANTIKFNTVDSSSFTAYTSGGYIRYNTPMSLASGVARLDIRDRVGGTLLNALSSTAGEIVLNDTTHTISIEIAASVTALMTYTKAVYDLEVELPSGLVAVLLYGDVIVSPEVTTST